MESQQMNLDVIANNLANVNTTGFKKSKIEFQDLLYQTTRTAGSEQGAGNQLPTGMQIGHGSRAVATSRIFTTGELSQTGEKLDVAIAGDGFFQVQLPDGSQAYTRDGAFKLSSNGAIVNSEGMQVLGGFPPVPATTTAVSISPTGEISLTDATGTSPAGRVNMTRFANPSGLEAIGRNLYKESPASGPPETGNPGEGGFGQLQQGYLEMSNVKVVEEMVKLIMAQRAYEVNSKAIQAADEMMQQSNNLSR
jgi:flagellar basal-body rod protein FlgG